jgi:Na+-transporting NADH:ubiquinone oxidoreductase subunit C
MVCSLLLAAAASALRPRQESNIALEKKMNVLKSLELYDTGKSRLKPAEIESLYRQRIEEKVIDLQGNEVTGMTVHEAEENPEYLQVYVRRDNGALAISLEGLGLWSELKCYLALERDGHTVMGITFYEQKETPGLGAEIEREWFTDNFSGKDVLNSRSELASITVVKGKALDHKGAEQENMVDGISGATMTVNGVNDMLRDGLKAYRPFLEKLWD